MGKTKAIPMVFMMSIIPDFIALEDCVAHKAKNHIRTIIRVNVHVFCDIVIAI